jgi:hypothetical protein
MRPFDSYSLNTENTINVDFYLISPCGTSKHDDHLIATRWYGVSMSRSAADLLDRRKHRGAWRFLHMDLKALLRRYLGWG